MRRSGWGLGGLALLAVQSHAGATEPAAGLAYRADPGCPDAAAFLSRLETTERVTIQGHESAGWDLAVTLEAGRDRSWRGRLVVRGAPRARELRGGSCEAVAAALAIATQLALDADAAPPADEPAPAAPEPERVEQARPAAAPSDAESRFATRSTHVRWGAGLAAGVVSGPMPGASLETAVFVDVEPGAPWALRVSGARIWPRTERYTWGSARVSALLGGLRVCPMRWRAGAFELRPCAGADAGVLEAEGAVSEIGGESRTSRQLWVDVAAAGRLAWLLGPRFRLELEGTLALPVTRYRYLVAGPETVVAEASWVEGGGLLGAVATFP